MLVLHKADNFDELIPLNLRDDEWFVTHSFDGIDTLEININSGNEVYEYISEEVNIDAIGLRGNDARFKVVGIDDHSNAVTVTCTIDLDDWKQRIIDSYRKLHANLPGCIDEIIPDGWTYEGANGFPTDVTVEDSRDEPFKACTPLEVLTGMAEIFGCTYNYDNINKRLIVIDPNSFEPSGEYLSQELNLKSLGYTGDTSSLATRLYAYGKRDDDGENPVSIESVNGGKPYIDNHSYTDKIIAVGWSDERYTIPEHLLEAAKEKLAELAVPVRSYECEVSRLQYSVWMYKVVTIIDVVRRTRTNQQVVEWKEYARVDQDVVTLSATTMTIEKVVSDIPNADDVVSDTMSDIQKVISNAVAEATDAITGNNGGYFKWIFDSEGRPIELVNLGDSLDINSAKQVWRWNASGLGHSENGYNGPYTLAILANGSINANVITTGTLNAEIIRAGILQDVKAKNFWNLETGEFQLTSSATVGGKTVQTIAEDAAEDMWDTTTQRDVFNKLTNNGSAQGIYMTGNQLYINGEYIKANTVSTNKIESARGSSNYVTVGTTTKGFVGTSFVNQYGNYCDIESLYAVDDSTRKTSGVGLSVLQKPFIYASTYYNHAYLFPPINTNGYTNQPAQRLMIRGSGGSYSGNANMITLQTNDNRGFWVSDSRVMIGFDSTHYIIVNSSGVQCRCGTRGFGWYNGSFSENLQW